MSAPSAGGAREGRAVALARLSETPERTRAARYRAARVFEHDAVDQAFASTGMRMP